MSASSLVDTVASEWKSITESTGGIWFVNNLALGSFFLKEDFLEKYQHRHAICYVFVIILKVASFCSSSINLK